VVFLSVALARAPRRVTYHRRGDDRDGGAFTAEPPALTVARPSRPRRVSSRDPALIHAESFPPTLPQYYELYRRSTLGMTLTDALDEMVTNGELTPSIAMKVLAQYDKCMNEALSSVKTKTTFKGNLDTYRFCDNVWTFRAGRRDVHGDRPGGIQRRGARR
jgi:transcription initiation factor TFIIA small subunit